MKALPSFADMMVMPRVVDKKCQVFMKDDFIAIRTNKPKAILELFEPYPHVRAQVDADGDVLLLPQPAHYERLLLAWPTGRRLGATVWNNTHFSLFTDSSVVEALSQGVAGKVIACKTNESVISVLEQHAHRAAQ